MGWFDKLEFKRTKKEELEELLYDLKKEYGFFRKITVMESSKKPHFSASINLATHALRINFNPDFDPTDDPVIRKYMKKKNVGEPIETVARDLLIHELGHWSHRRGYGLGCPITIDNDEYYFVDPIHKILKSKNYEGFTNYVVGICQDWINDTNCKRQGAKTGDILFYDDVGKNNTEILAKGETEEEKIEYLQMVKEYVKENKKLPKDAKMVYSPSYEAFIKLQMYTWGDSLDNSVLSKYYSNDERVIISVQNIIRRLGLKKKRRGLAGTKEFKYRDRDTICNFLMDKNKWKQISKVFAEEISDLLDQKPTESLFGSGGTFTIGDKEDPDNDNSGFKGGLEDTMNDPSNRRRFALSRYNKGEKKPSYMETFEYLDLIYQNLAKQIPINVDTITETSMMPIVPFGFEPFDREEHNVDEINWRKFMIDNGDINFGVANYHFEYPVKIKKGIFGFPRLLCAIFDTSGSMKEGLPDKHNPGDKTIMPWGNMSKYHYALISWYGMLEYLAHKNILPDTDVVLGNFSTKTDIARGIRASKKLALTPQFGTTYLNINKVREFFTGVPSICFTLSDGEIFNWDDIGDEYISLAKKQKYFHIQLGPDEKFTIDMKNEGLLVKNVNDGNSLVNMSINMTDAAFNEYIRESTRR